MGENMKFHNEDRLLTFDELISELVRFVKDQPEREYKIVVGTDSRASSPTRFVTAVSILRVKNGPTRELIDAVVGMVKGYGLEAVIKPDSFGAFVLADRHT